MSEKTADAETLPGDIQKLADAIAALPQRERDSLEPIFDQVASGALRRRKILNLVQDALSQLRLDMKYLMFDLEATRRERDEFQRQLGDAGEPGDVDESGSEEI